MGFRLEGNPSSRKKNIPLPTLSIQNSESFLIMDNSVSLIFVNFLKIKPLKELLICHGPL